MFRPMGKAIYFRTVTTDAYQGPGMANFIAQTLKAKTIYILDDSSAYGVGLANAFENQARKNGMTILGHDQLDPKANDYMTILTRIKAKAPEVLYYGGTSQAGIKLAKQSYDVLPKVIKAGGDGVFSAALLKGAGFPAMDGVVHHDGVALYRREPRGSAVDQALQCEVRPRNERLFVYLLRRDADHSRFDQAGGGIRRAGQSRYSARCDPGGECQDFARGHQLR